MNIPWTQDHLKKRENLTKSTLVDQLLTLADLFLTLIDWSNLKLTIHYPWTETDVKLYSTVSHIISWK